MAPQLLNLDGYESMEQHDYDVVVIGGGPAGSVSGSYLAKAGLKVIVLEREIFPRPHVGESLVPATTRVFKELGFLHKMEEAKFPKKFGATWTSNYSKDAMDVSYNDLMEAITPDSVADIRFEDREMDGVDQNYTYHVDRGLFDKMLLEHAAELGATTRQGVGVTSVDFSQKPLVYVHYKDDKGEGKYSCKMVVDASGRRTCLGNQLRLKVTDPVFDQYALHTWFEDYDRGSETQKDGDYIHIHFLPITNSWLWQIPITDRLTSFGVVTQKANFTAAKASREDFFWNCVKSRPEIYDKLKKSKQYRDFTTEADYSYAMSQICGDRFVLIGDAARFVDPIFSSGVSIAFRSAQLASADIIEAFKTGNFQKESFNNFESTIRRGCLNWYKFIGLYYRLNILFTYFIKNPKYRIDVLKLLQGDLYDDDAPPVLEKMREIVSAVEKDPNHIWHKLLGTLTADQFKPSF